MCSSVPQNIYIMIYKHILQIIQFICLFIFELSCSFIHLLINSLVIVTTDYPKHLYCHSIQNIHVKYMTK